MLNRVGSIGHSICSCIPPLAAARMQRWVLLLSTYQYKIQHIPGTQNTLADCMSQLPSLSEKRDNAERIHCVVLTEQLPILAYQIAKASETDNEISSIITCVQCGNWPSNIKSITTFYNQQNELSLVDGCLVWKQRVVIPHVFCQQLLKELHYNHICMSCMKALARSYLWWPQLDTEIEQIVKNCLQCEATAENPPAAPAHPWIVPQNPWEQVYVDHAQWKRWLLFVVVDALSKRPEVFIMNSTSASQTIDRLRTIFATHSLPVTLMSDNGPPFSSADFKTFMSSNSILQ